MLGPSSYNGTWHIVGTREVETTITELSTKCIFQSCIWVVFFKVFDLHASFVISGYNASFLSQILGHLWGTHYYNSTRFCRVRVVS